MSINKPIAKFIALILVSVCLAFIAMSADGTNLAKLDSMSAANFVEFQRKLYHHSFFYHYIIWLVIGGIYIASVEFFAYVIGLLFKKPSA